MANPLFIDVHILQTVPPSNINRDDTGSPKTARFGGVRRSRISSQAWKKATRDCFRQYFDSQSLGFRTKKVVERICDKVEEEKKKGNKEINRDDICDKAKKILSDYLKPTKKKDSKKKDPVFEDKSYVLKTLFFTSEFEIETLAKCVMGEEEIKNVKDRDLTKDTVDIALFGRMVATNPKLNVDAAVQVAHAISVGRAETEFDYFTALDDCAPEDNAGAAMIETTEFTSSTLYRYADIDVYHLRENLGSDEAACKGIEAFLKSFVCSMPTGKQNSFANRTLPAAIVVELREIQPVSLVNAFEKPIVATAEKSQTELACEALAKQESVLNKAFGVSPLKSFAVVGSPSAEGLKDFPDTEVVDLETLIANVSQNCAQYLAENPESNGQD